MAEFQQRRAPSAAQLAALRDAVLPDGRVGRVRRLRGGISCATHAVDLESVDGTRRALVVRRYNREWQQSEPNACAAEWRLLSLLQPAGLPVPAPVLLDAEGQVFGDPTIVLSRLPGRAWVTPRDVGVYVRRMAESLAALHAAAPPAADLAFLKLQQESVEEALAEGPSEEQREGNPFSAAVWEAMRAWWPRLERPAPALVHGDFWPGNTLWRYGRLTGIVDWEQPRLGDPAQDVGICRLDLTHLFGPEAADAFLRAYEAASGRALPQLFFWDLLIVTWAPPELISWLSSYHDLGRTDLTRETVRARLDAFAVDALRRAGA